MSLSFHTLALDEARRRLLARQHFLLFCVDTGRPLPQVWITAPTPNLTLPLPSSPQDEQDTAPEEVEASGANALFDDVQRTALQTIVNDSDVASHIEEVERHTTEEQDKTLGKTRAAQVADELRRVDHDSPAPFSHSLRHRSLVTLANCS